MTIVMVMMSAPGMARRSSFGAREYDDGSHCTLSSKTLHKFPKHPKKFLKQKITKKERITLIFGICHPTIIIFYPFSSSENHFYLMHECPTVHHHHTCHLFSLFLFYNLLCLQNLSL